MARQRFRRKDLKRPDEFVSRGTQLLEWSGANLRLLGWSAGSALAVVVLVTGFFSVRAARLRQANEDLARALSTYRASHYTEAATQFADVATHWPSTAPGRMASLLAANADLNAAQVDAAKALLTDAASVSDWPPYLQQQALVALAVALERKDDVHGAADRYAAAAAIDGPYTAAALLGEARLREQLGEKDKALALYERFTRDYPQAPDKEIVTAKVDQLKS